MKGTLSILTVAAVVLSTVLAAAHQRAIVIPLQSDSTSKLIYHPLASDSPTGSHYTDNSDGTLIDNVTGLIWQKEDDNNTRTWIDARNFCQFKTDASFTDWRLPSISELTSIVDYETNTPAANSVFTGTNAGLYWSETVSANYGGNMWAVNFDTGHMAPAAESDLYYVRCVR